MQVAVAAPAEDVRVTFARAFAAPVEEEDAVAVLRTSMRVCFCGPERPGKAITVAPFRDGMNHPSSRSLARRERHVLVGRTEIRGRHDRPEVCVTT